MELGQAAAWGWGESCDVSRYLTASLLPWRQGVGWSIVVQSKGGAREFGRGWAALESLQMSRRINFTTIWGLGNTFLCTQSSSLALVT